MKQILGLLAVGLLAGPMLANATVVSQALRVTGSDFALSFGSSTPAAVDPVTIDFNVTFDNSANISATTTGLTVNSFNLPYAVAYSYSASNDIFVIATSPTISGCVNPSSSFCIGIGTFSTSPSVLGFIQNTTGGQWQARTVTLAPSSVPEPGTLALLGLGLAGLGLSRWRKA